MWANRNPRLELRFVIKTRENVWTPIIASFSVLSFSFCWRVLAVLIFLFTFLQDSHFIFVLFFSLAFDGSLIDSSRIVSAGQTDLQSAFILDPIDCSNAFFHNSITSKSTEEIQEAAPCSCFCFSSSSSPPTSSFSLSCFYSFFRFSFLYFPHNCCVVNRPCVPSDSQNVFHTLLWWRVLWWCLLFKPTATMVQALTDATRFQHTDFQHVKVRNMRPRWATGPRSDCRGPRPKSIPHAVPSIWKQWEQTGRWNEQNSAADSLFALAQESKAPSDDEDDGMYLRGDICWRKRRTLSPAEVLPAITLHSFLRPPAVWLFPHAYVPSGTLLSCCCCRGVSVEPNNYSTQTKCLVSARGLLDSRCLMTVVWWACDSSSALISEDKSQRASFTKT